MGSRWTVCDLGFYSRQLRRYFGVFQKTRINVFLYEDLQKDAQGLIESLLEFLEVESSHAPYIRTDLLHNRFSVPRNQLAQTYFRSRIFRAKRSSALRASMIPNNQTRSRVREELLFRDAAMPQMDREAAGFLAKLYREDIQQLQGLLDRDLGHWLRTA